jgi:hypothetical protein
MLFFFDKWSGIEQSCLLLLENKHVHTTENKEGLIFFLKSLYAMRETSLTTGRQCGDFTNSVAALHGIQSSLNQAVDSIKIDMKQFLDFIEQMSASINRILDKSKFVVGDIDYTTDIEDDGEEINADVNTTL